MKQGMKILFSLGIVFLLTTSAWASISYTPSSPKVGETVTFTVTPPSGDIVGSIAWDFGDGTTKTVSPPKAEHTYSSPGTYSVRATYRYQVAGAPEIEQTDTTSITVAPAPTPSISFSPAHPTAGEVVTFTAHNFSSTSCIKWDFGDGTITNDNSPPSITHIYIHPGTYTVKAYDNCGAEVTATTTVSVGGAERYISYTPAEPRVNEEVTFKANNFFSDRIKWDFGDGTVIPQGSPTARHTYRSAGTYAVKAWDYYGQGQVQTTQQTLPAVTTQITVSPDIRAISYTPTPAVATREVTFTASNFRSTCIKWDFGDGTIIAKGSSHETHIYKTEGTYSVKAYDNCGQDKFPKSITLRVLPRRGPAAPFCISFIQLRFKDGKAYKQVPKDFSPLVAFADIKYEGTGILQAEWLIDGKRFQIISRSLPYAKEKTISSGKFPPLPTQMPGPHEVTLNVIQPQPDFKIPTIRYFVSAEEVKKKVVLSISQVKDLEGNIITVEEARLSLKPDKHYIFSGTIENISGEEIASVFLQVSLADKVVDQQTLKKLGPGEERRFETSILNDATTEKKLTLRVFHTPARAKTLARRELIVSAPPRPELMREVTERERLRLLEGEGPEGVSVLTVHNFTILDPGSRGWGFTASYEYNGSGSHEDINFLILVENQGPGDFSGTISAEVYSYPIRATQATPYVTLAPGDIEPVAIHLNQSAMIDRWDPPPGTYQFRARIRPSRASPEEPPPEWAYSSREVILDLCSHIPSLRISEFEILDGALEGPEESERSWGSTGIYVYNGGGVHDDIVFRVKVLNQTDETYSRGFSFLIRSGSVSAYWSPPRVELGAHEESEYFYITMNQSTWIHRGELALDREYRFWAEVESWSDGNPEWSRSSNYVSLYLIPPPMELAETFTLMSEDLLTGSIDSPRRWEYLSSWITWENVIVGAGWYEHRGFMSFDLSSIEEKIEQWRREGWTGFKVWDAKLKMEEYQVNISRDSWALRIGPVVWLDTRGQRMQIPCEGTSPEVLEHAHEVVGGILLDHLDFGQVFTEIDYDADMISNIREFESACGVHTLTHLEANVQWELGGRGMIRPAERTLAVGTEPTNRIQFRLRLADQEITADAYFRKPCRLIVTVFPN